MLKIPQTANYCYSDGSATHVVERHAYPLNVCCHLGFIY